MPNEVRPTFWRERYRHGEGVSLIECKEQDAHFISSAMSDGRHRILLDIDKSVNRDGSCLCLESIQPWKVIVPDWIHLETDLARTRVGKVESSSRIRFNHPFELRPSTTPGHVHVVMDLPPDRLLSFPDYHALLQGLCRVGVVDGDWVHLVWRHRQGLLLKPGVSKAEAYLARVASERTENRVRAMDMIFAQSPYGDSPYEGRGGQRRGGGGFSD